MASDADSNLHSRCRAETLNSPVTNENVSKKWSRMHDRVEKDMVNLMGWFYTDISSHMREIKTNLGTERGGIELRTQIQAAIKSLNGLYAKEKL